MPSKRVGFAVICGLAVFLSVFNFVRRQPDVPAPLAAPAPAASLATAAPIRANPPPPTAAPPPPRVASSRRDILAYLNGSCPALTQQQPPPRQHHTHTPASCLRPYQYVRRWIDRLSPAAISARSWTVVNVGANKGYAAASVLDALGIRGFTAAGVARALHVHASYTARIVESCADQLCGDCCECAGDGNDAAARQRRLPKSRRPSSWSAYVIEPAHASFEFLKSYFDAGGDQVAWTTAGAPPPPGEEAGYRPAAAAGGAVVEHALVGGAHGDVDFPDCSLGAEDCHVFAHPGRRSAGQRSVDLKVAGADYRAPSQRRRTVKAVRLDDVLPPDVRYIDVLVTSTAGADFAVADSLGQRFFDASSVGLYIWEVPKTHRQHLDQHGRRQAGRQQRSFDAQIRKLERASMVCYLPLDVPFDHDHHHQPSLVRISHGCKLPSALLAAAHSHLLPTTTTTTSSPPQSATAASEAVSLDATVGANASSGPTDDSHHVRASAAERDAEEQRSTGHAAVERDLHIVCASVHERHLIDALRSFEAPDMDDAQVHQYYAADVDSTNTTTRRERQHVSASFAAGRCDVRTAERSFYELLRRELNGRASAGPLPPYESCRLSSAP